MILLEKSPFPIAMGTHPGMTGKNNEDRYAISGFRLNLQDTTPVLLAVLADGIGGHRAGEIAAQIAVDRITRVVSASAGDHPLAILEDAVVQASQEIQGSSQADPARFGMGATCAVAWIIGQRLYTVSVGDSRIYLMRNGGIQQLSIDHTWIQEALDSGIITPEEVHGHPNAHVIRRYLGSPQPPDVDHRIRLNAHESDEQSMANQGLLLQPGDRIMLCSDGLTDLVNQDEILAAYQRYSNGASPRIAAKTPVETAAGAAVQTLIDLANSRGGHDNITILTILIPSSLPRVIKAFKRPPRASVFPAWRYLATGCLVTLLIAAIISAVIIGYSYISSPTEENPPTATLQILTGSQPPSDTQTPQPTATLQPLPTETLQVTRPLPEVLVNGNTLTPWPTNTYPPSATPTITSTPTITLTRIP